MNENLLINEIRRKRPAKAKNADWNGSRSAAIELFCIECSGDSIQTAKSCTVKSCVLWQYRPGGTKGNPGITYSEQEYDELIRKSEIQVERGKILAKARHAKELKKNG